MNLYAILPVKSLDAGKGRLAAVLAPPERRALNAELLDHMLAVTSIFPGAARTIVTSPDPDVLDRARAAGAIALPDATGELNAALDAARRHAMTLGAEAILVVPVDLPLAGPEDLLAMTTGRDGIVIVPDRRGTGTNALYLAPPDALAFRFGDDSFDAHLAGARATALTVEVATLPKLAFDIDTPEDYERWRRSASSLEQA